MCSSNFSVESVLPSELSRRCVFSMNHFQRKVRSTDLFMRYILTAWASPLVGLCVSKEESEKPYYSTISADNSFTTSLEESHTCCSNLPQWTLMYLGLAPTGQHIACSTSTQTTPFRSKRHHLHCSNLNDVSKVTRRQCANTADLHTYVSRTTLKAVENILPVTPMALYSLNEDFTGGDGHRQTILVKV